MTSDRRLTQDEYDELVAGQRLADEFAATYYDSGNAPSDAVHLSCGHWTREAAAVTFSSGRRLYECPVGCGLQDRDA